MADEVVRKRSPRAPSIPLAAAVERVLKIYDVEGRHNAPAEAVAQHIGYKSGTSGAAKTMLASLGYYGLLDRPKDGFLAVTKSVEEFKFAPAESMKYEILERWLRAPEVFAELLEKYPSSLPSQATLKFDLIQKGFSSDAADDCVSNFIQSVNYVRSVAQIDILAGGGKELSEGVGGSSEEIVMAQTDGAQSPSMSPQLATIGFSPVGPTEGYDLIPVRLSGGRKAWLTIPSVFYEADKQRLISQIQLLLTEDEN